MATHNLLGTSGESLAVKWLLDKGFFVLHQNWRYSHFEIDIIASRENVLHFIEVKTRRNKKFGEPEESVSRRKINNLLNAGSAYQSEYPLWKRVQYDVLSISLFAGEAAKYFFIEDVYL